MCFAPQCRAIFRQFFDIRTSKYGPRTSCFSHFDLQMCFSLQRRATFGHLNFQKVLRTWCVLHILTCKRASRCSGVQFFDIRTSKSRSEAEAFCTFWLARVLLATAACNFWTSELPKSAPDLVCFAHFALQTCFSLQRRAIFHFSSQQLPPHPQLDGAYFSTQPPHKSLKKHSISRLP